MSSDSGVEVSVEPTLTGRLGAAYPAGRHDVELRVRGVADRAELTTVLAAESTQLLEADPSLRKIVFAVAADDVDAMAAAEAAGFRYVVDVDVPEGGETLELSLLVREPAAVTQVDMDLDRVPGS